MAKSKLDNFTLFHQFPKEIRLMIWERALPGPRVVNLRQRKLKKTIGEWERETGHTWPPPRKELIGKEVYTDDKNDTDSGDDDGVILDLRDDPLWRGRQRSIVAYRARAHAYDEEAYQEAHLVGWVSDCPAPAVLSVCREAFEVVSKSYERVFLSLGANATIWFCFEHDTLYLRYDDLLGDAWDTVMLNMVSEIVDSAFMFLDMDALRRVKSLALLVSEDWDQEREELIADFSAAIGGLEKLHLVAKEYQENCDDRKSLAIMEPIDFFATMAVYENVKLEPSQRWPSGILLTPRFIPRHAVIKMHEIRAMLEDDVKAGDPPWRIPVIEEKAIFTLEMIERMESTRQKSQKELDDLNERFLADQEEQDKTRKLGM